MIESIINNPALLAGIFTLIGGVALKILESFLNKKSENREVRKDLLDEVKNLNNRLDKVEGEVTFWRGRFYEEQEDNALLRIMMIQGGLTPPHKIVVPPGNSVLH